MFPEAELARLRAQKDLLILESSLKRVQLAADCQRLRSPELWAEEAARAVGRHPLLTAALAAGGGMLVVQALRRRGRILGGIASLGKLASLALTVWKLVRRHQAER